jgi:uncharacterized protein YjbJ (UPF0337 family)
VGNGEAASPTLRSLVVELVQVRTVVDVKIVRTEAVMPDKDRIKGSAEQAKGKVKETAGKVSGDRKLEGEGKADPLKGKVRNAVGGLKDTLRGK